MRKESNDPLITTFGDVIKAHKYVSLSNYYLLGWFNYNCLIEHRLRKSCIKENLSFELSYRQMYQTTSKTRASGLFVCS